MKITGAVEVIMKQHVPPKCWYLPASPRGVNAQKTKINVPDIRSSRGDEDLDRGLHGHNVRGLVDGYQYLEE